MSSTLLMGMIDRRLKDIFLRIYRLGGTNVSVGEKPSLLLPLILIGRAYNEPKVGLTGHSYEIIICANNLRV